VSGTRFVQGYLPYLLSQANHAMYRPFDQHLHEAGLSSLEWRVLATLSDSEPLPVSRLAAEVLAKQPTVTKLVRRMGAQGWVQLTADPQDQRRTLVSATASGRRLVKPLIAAAREQEAHAILTLSATEVGALKRLLGKLVQAR
jgi:DNA-binding MarR family transcriptional regulator